MDTELFRQQREHIQRHLAEGIGCTPDDFAGERLTIVDRPAQATGYVALAVTFGMGTVVSVEPRFRPFVEAHAPKPHFHSLYPELLQRLASDCSTASETLTYHIPDIWWALSEAPAGSQPPPGYSIHAVDAAWMNSHVSDRRWENAVGEPGEGREARNQLGLALLDPAGGPVAVAGAFLTYGMHEIGVDVARAHRGKGFGAHVVRALTRQLLDRGDTPLYVCSTPNIRSQRNALACGFLPVCSDASVTAARRA